MTAEAPVICLTIAGSDSGGGAGIQADLKAFARCGVHGTTAITAITSQNTVAVERVDPVAPEAILAQVRAVASDMRIAAVKIGMVGSASAIAAVAIALDELPAGTPVVLDPVMVAESGGRLLESEAERALVEQLLPRATVVTPNIAEARVLSRYSQVPDAESLEGEQLARAVIAAGARAVILTGGHTEVGADLLIESDEAPVVILDGPRHPDGAAHGSGCTHAAVLAAQLGLGRPLPEAARVARALAAEAVAHGLSGAGAGAGPVNILGPVVESQFL